MLSHVCDLAVAAGCTRIDAWFLPTKKNEPAARIYSGNGFTKTQESPSGSLWQFSLRGESIRRPAWIAQMSPSSV